MPGLARCLPTVALLAAAACGPARPPSQAPDTDPPRASGGEKPDPWTDCYNGLSYAGNPRTDIARLTKACGAIAGMRPVTPVTIGAQTAKDPADRYTFYVPKIGTCYRIYATGDRGIHDLDVGIRGPDGDDLVADLTSDGHPVVPPGGPVCFKTAGLYMLEVSVYRGSGRYAVQVWGGNPEF